MDGVVVAARRLLVFAVLYLSTVRGSSSWEEYPLSGLTFLNQQCSSPAPHDQTNFDIHTYERHVQDAAYDLTIITDACCDHYYKFLTGDAPHTVYAIALCRGDVGTDRCLLCLQMLSIQQVLYPSELAETCTRQNLTEGIIWYAECMFRYANRPINDYEASPAYNWSDWGGFTDHSPIPYTALTGLWDVLARGAQAGDYHLKFAAGEARNSSSSSSSGIVYATAQCTPTLSAEECGDCLGKAINYTEPCCVGRQGFVLLPCCSFMYDTLLFYNVSTPAYQVPTPPLTLQPPPSPSFTSGRMVAVHVIVSATVAALLTLMCTFGCSRKHRAARKRFEELPQGDGFTRPVAEGSIWASEYECGGSFHFPYNTIRTATDDFHQQLGRGGFGPVYKGKLTHGQEIAVKKLSHKSAQGDREFVNEVRLLAKIQHRNLVKLLGFSLRNEDRLLIYEYLPNRSLDIYLFDPIKRATLDWGKRYNIIRGVARGIMYLHEDSRLKIIHCDLKAGNILLDEEMNARISDFGLAKLFEIDQSYKHTDRFAGTFGYAAPEYAIEGFISAKSDVYSFGIIVLEILTGLQNSKFRTEDDAESLISYVWKNWNQTTPLDVMDPVLLATSLMQVWKNWNQTTPLDVMDPVLLATSLMQVEIIRCTHIALLCIEENAANRPSMTQVVAMLSNCVTELRSPFQPAFIATGNSCSGPAAQFIQILELAEFDSSDENQRESSGSAAV